MSLKGQLFVRKSSCKISVLLGLILTGLTSMGYCQSVKYPPTGKLVDAGGHKLHLHIMGKGKPVVVFENGSGDFSFIWDLVQPEVSQTATTVSYDRAGFAWSEEGPSPRSGRQIAYELHTALHNAGIKGPYILVGQSFGGFLVRTFARFYKNEVAGVVLVDALNEDSRVIIGDKPMRIREWAKGQHAPEPQNMTKRIAVSDTSNPIRPDTAIDPVLRKLPLQDQKMQIWAQSQPVFRKAAGNEMNWSPEDVADMYANKGKPDYKLGNIPLFVLARANGGYSGLADSVSLETERIQLQKDLSNLSTNSKLVFDRNSGHNIHLEDPALVIDAIKQVIRSYQTNTKL